VASTRPSVGALPHPIHSSRIEQRAYIDDRLDARVWRRRDNTPIRGDSDCCS